VRIAICDYGAGNVRSVEIAFRRLGAELIDDSYEADLAVLPGVGSARAAMNGLRARGHDLALRTRISEGRPVLGICLGLQLALDQTEEDDLVTGLGLLPGTVAVSARSLPAMAAPPASRTTTADSVATTPRRVFSRLARSSLVSMAVGSSPEVAAACRSAAAARPRASMVMVSPQAFRPGAARGWLGPWTGAP